MTNVYGPANALGYGIHCQNMLKALSELDKVSFTLIGQPQPDPYFTEVIARAASNLDTFSSNDPSLFIFHDHASHTSSGKPLAVFSVFEASQLLPNSINMLKNGPCDIILTTTQEHKTILDSLDLGKPVHVVHEGIDPDVYSIGDKSKFFDTKKFTFLLAGKREKRKNTDMTFKVMLEECMYKESTIICHTYNPFLSGRVEKPIHQWIGLDPTLYGFKHNGFNKNHHHFSNGVCDVILTTPDFRVQEMPYLYRSANVGVCCSSTEGWGLPTQELMACGVPVIATNCMGHKEFLPIDGIQSELTISCSENEPANDNIWFKNQGEWSKIDEEAVRSKIRYCLDNQDKFSDYNKELSSYTRSNFTWVKAAIRVRSILRGYTN